MLLTLKLNPEVTASRFPNCSKTNSNVSNALGAYLSGLAISMSIYQVRLHRIRVLAGVLLAIFSSCSVLIQC